MVPITWDASNTAEIEFCGDGGSVYGYRLPGESTCGPAGIVIRMQPGQNHTLVLRNTASVPTNLHTHGLHISGSGNADDVTRSVDGGMCLTYHLDIPVEHMGGTFWMHPHRHGLTNVQVSGGAYVMLIIDEQPNLLESVDAASRIGIEKWLGNELLLVASSVGRNVLGNGKSDLELIMASNQWYRLRVAAVDPEGIRSNLVFPGTCDVHTVAYDGVWRFEVPRAEFNLEHSLTGASRRDVAIRCTAIGEHAIYFGPDASMLATLKVGIGIVGIGAFRNRPKTPEASPYTITGSSWQPYRPNYLRDLSEEHSTLFEPFNVTAGATHINGLSYNPLEPLREFDYDTLQEWTIFNTAWHPFHMHVYHMQPFGCQGHEDGEYVDTVSSPTPGCVVRFHIIDVASRVVMHCHVLIHGDAGAMAWINITNGGPIQSSVDREQYTCPTR
jgi:FtsP/CotA-like multicopper oxidase with cupredoxin domain